MSSVLCLYKQAWLQNTGIYTLYVFVLTPFDFVSVELIGTLLPLVNYLDAI